MNQTASALHDELAHNDVAGLRQSLNSVSRNDLEIVEADYKTIGGKSFIDSVDKDPSVSPAAKDVVHQKLAETHWSGASRGASRVYQLVIRHHEKARRAQLAQYQRNRPRLHGFCWLRINGTRETSINN